MMLFVGSLYDVITLMNDDLLLYFTDSTSSKGVSCRGLVSLLKVCRQKNVTPDLHHNRTFLIFYRSKVTKKVNRRS